MMVERHRNVLRDMENDDIRVEPLAFDRKGGAYFYFPQFYQVRYEAADEIYNSYRMVVVFIVLPMVAGICGRPGCRLLRACSLL